MSMSILVNLPTHEYSFGIQLQTFIDKYAGLWVNAPSEMPASRLFTPATQARNELETNRLVDWLEKELQIYPDEPGERAVWRERIFGSLRRIGKECFEFPESHFDIIFSEEYFEVTRQFARQARLFDKKIQPEALAQALRNVWVMNLVQMFLGRQPSLSPSIFAYSMLYPYTDNYLDQPEVRRETKEEVCRRLGRRLDGLPIRPCSDHEAAVFRLIRMIESEYPRQDFPDVYASLRAIHDGQVKSLSQQRGNHPPSESSLVRISVEKGGSSVLADGWLAAGKLTPEMADFFFGFGVVLQLLDDLQDLPDDRKAGHWTLFSRSATAGKLNCLTNRLWNFMNLVLDTTSSFQSPRGGELKDIIRRNSRMLMLRGVAQNAEFYTDDYLCRLERSSPLSLSWLRDTSATAENRFRKIWPALAKRRNLHSIFDLLD